MEYRQSGCGVSAICYHIVFCPRYRRKIFLIEGLEECFRQTVNDVCSKRGFRLINLQCFPDYCHLTVQTDSDTSAAEVAKIIKTESSEVLKRTFGSVIRTETIWTRDILVMTEGRPSQKRIQQYVEQQKTRG